MKDMKELIRTLRFRILQCWFRLRSPKMNPEGRILILAPHPDDEVLGCGGLITRLVQRGREVEVCIISDGANSHNHCCDTPKATIASKRQLLAYNAASILGLSADRVHFLNLPDGNIPSDYRLDLPFQPDVILVPHKGEGWPDHLAVREIGMRLSSPQTQVYEYCVWMWYYNVRHILLQKAFVLKMSKEEYAIKLRAITAYSEPKAPCGKPWSGVLPRVLLKANSTKIEVFFPCDTE